MRFAFLFLFLFITACSHQQQQKAVQDTDVIILPSSAHNFEMPVTAGKISRYERKMIVPGGPNGEMSPCAKNFDGIMDNLEDLMSDKIRKNNEIAARQAAGLRY